MPYQDDDLKWLENERRGKQKPAPFVSTADPDLEWLEKERQAGAFTPTFFWRAVATRNDPQRESIAAVLDVRPELDGRDCWPVHL